jgi:HK97 family phage portal protein
MTTKALSMLGAVRNVWTPLIREPFAGAWQKNREIRLEDTLCYWPVFRCVSVISSDIAKLGLDLVQDTADGIRTKVIDRNVSPLLRKPNPWQTRIQFFESWLQSKLTRGNTYVLKGRDGQGNITALYVLEPSLVVPMVADNGEVFYDLKTDRLSGLRDTQVMVPASEIIHDRWNTLYHPLVGLSPIYAAGTKALTGLRIQNASSKFFEKGAMPGGVLTAPGAISDSTAERLKELWETGYSGDNAGKIAVLGDGLRFEKMTVSAEDSQLIEQLKWTAEAICGAFGVPVYMVMGTPPTYNNVQALTQQYYSQCLQILIESIELLLDEGLGLVEREGRRLSTMFDLDDLLRMDTATLIKAEAEAVGGGIKSPNEARRKIGLPPVEGGESPYLQQQNYSLAALARRDREEPPPDRIATEAARQIAGFPSRIKARAQRKAA